MSGPKVVRIVTLEEVQAICNRLMAQVKSGGEDLCRLAERLELLDGDIQASVALKSAQLKAMFDEGKYLDLQKLAGNVLAFYPSEKERLKAKAVAAAEAARTRRRRLVDGARTIADALRAAGRLIPPELPEIVSKAASAPDAELAGMESQLGAALATIPPTGGAAAASDSSSTEFAKRLSGNEESLTLAQWVSSRGVTISAADRRLDNLLAEIGSLSADEALPFEARVASIASEASSSRRALLTDSLVLEVSGLVTGLRRKEEALTTMRDAFASLEASSGKDAEALKGRLGAAIAEARHETADTLAAEAKGVIEAEEKAMAATARRKAVLGALSTLGYEVRETLEQAWLDDGRIVVRKPGTTDYGVEVGGPGDASRLQVRLVGSDKPSQPRTTARDTEHEATWCGEFSKLQELIASEGGELVIERALAVGAQPVRTVSMPGSAAAEAEAQAVHPELRRNELR